MNELIQLSYMALAVARLLFLRLLMPHDDPQKDELWKKLDNVGVPSGILPWTCAVFGSWTKLKQNTHEDYENFFEHNPPFLCVAHDLDKQGLAVLPPSALRLTNRPDSVLLAYWALVENIKLSYFIPDRNVVDNVTHFEVSRKDLTLRRI